MKAILPSVRLWHTGAPKAIVRGCGKAAPLPMRFYKEMVGSLLELTLNRVHTVTRVESYLRCAAKVMVEQESVRTQKRIAAALEHLVVLFYRKENLAVPDLEKESEGSERSVEDIASSDDDDEDDDEPEGDAPATTE